MLRVKYNYRPMAYTAVPGSRDVYIYNIVCTSLHGGTDVRLLKLQYII